MSKPSSELKSQKGSKKLDAEKAAEKKGADRKGKREEKERKSVPKVVEIVEEDPIEKPPNLFEVGSPQKFAHIEYELLPERVPFKIDVNCWGKFAKVMTVVLQLLFNLRVYCKIYCEDESRAIRTIQINQIAWVPVKIKYFVKRMTKSELQKLQFHVIKFTIWSRQDNLEQQLRF